MQELRLKGPGGHDLPALRGGQNPERLLQGLLRLNRVSQMLVPLRDVEAEAAQSHHDVLALVELAIGPWAQAGLDLAHWLDG